MELNNEIIHEEVLLYQERHEDDKFPDQFHLLLLHDNSTKRKKNQMKIH